MAKKNTEPKPAPAAEPIAPPLRQAQDEAQPQPQPVAVYSDKPDVPVKFAAWRGPAHFRLFLPDGSGWFMFDEAGHFQPLNQPQVDVLLEWHKRHQAGWAGYPDIHPVQ